MQEATAERKLLKITFQRSEEYLVIAEDNDLSQSIRKDFLKVFEKQYISPQPIYTKRILFVISIISLKR
jgi:hypothetical protein